MLEPAKRLLRVHLKFSGMGRYGKIAYCKLKMQVFHKTKVNPCCDENI